ncbi:hypothetical protein HPB49_018825 [Dermacentor silvarum]|uniref:Uncharacterized protein n=1 Tax=Dermacentor silvarum TaxID=543639 RepID=A0ACB8CM64_DERSI|nr:hypothetical protein HPB49_018825 [Dermacentor silvarum]
MPKSDLWRLDASLLTDPESIASIGASLADLVERSAEHRTWDDFKTAWRPLLTRAGRDRKMRITHELNEILRRMRIVRNADSLTFAMQDYLDLLKARYETLLRQSSRAASIATTQGKPLSDPAVLRYIRAGSAEDKGSTRIPYVTLPDGALSDRSSDICTVFTKHVAEVLTAKEGSWDRDDYSDRLREFCRDLPQVSEDILQRLCEPVTPEELRAVVKDMNASSAPGPDGIPIQFYVRFFDAVKESLLSMDPEYRELENARRRRSYSPPERFPGATTRFVREFVGNPLGVT